MARITIVGLDEFESKLQTVADHADGINKAAVWEGAKVIADKVKSNINSLPVDSWRPKNSTMEPYNVLTQTNKNDLLQGFGIRTIELTGNGAETIIGFAGYGSAPSEKYPQGIPNAMLARSIESGSSARAAHPFVRTAANSAKGEAQEAMARKAEQMINDMTK